MELKVDVRSMQVEDGPSDLVNVRDGMRTIA